MITENFPTIDETYSHAVSHDENTEDAASTCNCPKRELPPPPPTQLPFPAVDENRMRLQEFILNHYRASTFNVCEPQPLPLMEGPPLMLMVDQNAEPVAHHSPIPVPIHW